MNTNRVISLILALMLLVSLSACAQKARGKKLCVAFYNVENLFDTIDQDNQDEDFTPSGLNAWDEHRYTQKLHNISTVISKIGEAEGPDILGLAEIENRGVLEDLIATPALADKGYSIVHYDSPDKRGIDCALLYKKARVKVLHTYPYPVRVPQEPHIKTRDILYVKGKVDGEVLHFMVAHWPSRSGGQVETEPRRIAAARAMKALADSILSTEPRAKILMMGDLNDNPIDTSLKDVLEVKYKPKGLMASDLYTPMYDLYKTGQGTLAHKGIWCLFDIMIVSGSLMDLDSKGGYRLYFTPKDRWGAFIFNDDMIVQQHGRYKGYPKRTFSGKEYHADGYADHFPVYIYLTR